MRSSDRSQLAVMAAVLLAATTLSPLTVDRAYLTTGGMLVLVIGLVSLLLRRLRVAESVVLPAQALIWAGAVLFLAASTPGTGSSWYEHTAQLLVDGTQHMQTQAAPMSPNGGVRLMLVGAVGLILILTDLLVLGVHRPSWAIAPLATLFLIPAIGLPVDTGPLAFLAVAAGYLLVLGVEGFNRSAGWTRGLSRDSAGSAPAVAGVVARAATYVGIPAVVLALILAPLTPTLSLSGFGFGNGSGNGGPLQLADPTLDLRRNLRQPADQEVITYRSSDDKGKYLRMASLPELSNRGWGNAQFALLDQLPSIPGVGTEPSTRVTTTIRIEDFTTQYLPLPYAPRSFTAPGDWGIDGASLVVVAKEGSGDLRNVDYSADSVTIEPTAEELSRTTAGNPQDASTTAARPADLPQSIIDLTQRVTEGQSTDAGKAAAIQRYLRSDVFTYDTRPQPGTGYDALVNFLTVDHRGYCEQFAGSMAAMARVAGIPSRVAVGFLPGDKQGDTWHVKIRQMHAWPELYFAGYGWVRYEPTKSVANAPSWTQQADNPNSTEGPSASATDQPTDEPSTLPSQQTDPGASTAPTAETGAPGWLRPLGVGALSVGVLALLALPGAIRVRRRAGRLADDEAADVRVEGAWAEVRDTVVDLGGRWPGGSPRVIGTEVAARLDPESSARMGQLATLVERSRYSRSLDAALVPSDLGAATQEIRRSLAENRTRRQRVLAAVAPRSLAQAVRARFRRR